MKNPRRLYPNECIIYHPELSTCLVCGGPLMLANYLLGDKTVQTLNGVLSVASRPASCADPQCAGATMRLRSVAGQQVALPHTTRAMTWWYESAGSGSCAAPPMPRSTRT